MKILKFVFTVLLLFGVSYYLFIIPLPTVCDSTIAYRIGTIDNRFNLSESEFSNDISQAATVWDSVVSKKLFIHDSNAELKINLIFDERQSLSEAVQNTEKQTLEHKQQLESDLGEYKQRSAAFDEHLNVLNSQIEGWNKRGGAPEEEYKRLQEEADALKKEADELNAMAARLNINVEDYNGQIGKLNQAANSLSNVLLTKPEAGIYDPKENKIDIYFNVSKAELIHTLEHEFGHVLGLEHVRNPSAIMYSRSSEIVQPAEDDISQLKNRCKKLTTIKYIQKVIKARYNQ